MKGYKGFNKGMVCRGKQYAENATFEEPGDVELCKSGMHFCKNPFDVLRYYPFVNGNGTMNEFAEVEVLGDCKTDSNKSVTNKLHIGAKMSIAELVKAFVDFTLSKTSPKNIKATNTADYSAATNTGDRSAATNTGWCSAATNTGDFSVATNTGDSSAAANTGNCSAATNTGDWSVAEVSGNDSFAICTGVNGKAKGKLGCYIALAEYGVDKGHYHLRFFKTHKVDNETIKADTWYTLKNGEFCVAE